MGGGVRRRHVNARRGCVMRVASVSYTHMRAALHETKWHSGRTPRLSLGTDDDLSFQGMAPPQERPSVTYGSGIECHSVSGRTSPAATSLQPEDATRRHGAPTNHRLSRASSSSARKRRPWQAGRGVQVNQPPQRRGSHRHDARQPFTPFFSPAVSRSVCVMALRQMEVSRPVAVITVPTVSCSMCGDGDPPVEAAPSAPACSDSGPTVSRPG